MQKSSFKKVICAILSSALAFSSIASVSAVTENSDAQILSQYKIIDGKAVLVKNNEVKPEAKGNPYGLIKANDLPDKYSLVEKGQVSAVRDQYPYGTCWSFCSLGSMETAAIKAGLADNNIDLSEKHMAWFTFNGKDYSDDKSLFAGEDTFDSLGYSPFLFGGTEFMAAATLMRRYGAADEKKAPYEFKSGESLDDSLKTIDDLYLKDVYFLPESVEVEYDNYGNLDEQKLRDKKYVTQSINSIKDSLMNYGGVSISFYSSDNMSGYTDGDIYWNDNKNSYYFNAKNKDGSDNLQFYNHGAIIVGWDDNYSKNNFSIAPPANGAWIVKNSWSEDWGDNGYFYLSYYDLSISTPCVFIPENTEYKTDGTTQHEFKNIYQYDGLSFGAGQIYSERSNYQAANFFTARGHESLEAISTASTYPNCRITYLVYKNLKSDVDPTTGSLVASGSKYFDYAGFHTLELDKPVELNEGEKYAVVIKIGFSYGGYDCTILPCETKLIDYIDIDANAGESSYCELGKWNKITDKSKINVGYESYSIGNANVKVYTNDIADIVYGDLDDDGTVSVKDATITQKYLASTITLDEKHLKCADFNRDGIVNITDATAIQKSLVGLK